VLRSEGVAVIYGENIKIEDPKFSSEILSYISQFIAIKKILNFLLIFHIFHKTKEIRKKFIHHQTSLSSFLDWGSNPVFGDRNLLVKTSSEKIGRLLFLIKSFKENSNFSRKRVCERSAHPRVLV
jgi:hypothetical protein